MSYSRSFSPPYCPNSECDNFRLSDEKSLFYKKDGFRRTKRDAQPVQRYKCLSCARRFSRSNFDLHYRQVKRVDYNYILHHSVQGVTNRSMARFLGVAEATIRRKLRILTRQVLLRSSVLEKGLAINEPVAYDGFESFSYSQYDPCYINTSVGAESLFNYTLSFSPMNRKGRMTDEQKRKLKELIKKHGKYPSNAIQVSAKEDLDRLIGMSDGKLILRWDGHKSYGRALNSTDSAKVNEEYTNSKQRRDGKNPLFPINHLHMLYRHNISSHRRETIAFHKNEAGLMEKMTLYRAFKNYMSPRFIGGPKSWKTARVQSPAMYLGITKKIMKLNDFLSYRLDHLHAKLNQTDEKIFRRDWGFSRRKICGY